MTRAVIAIALALSACASAQQSANLAAAASILNSVATIGSDIVTFDCQNAGLIQVIAKDAGAAARVQAVLQKNIAIAIDACPAITGSPAVTVVSAT